MTSTTTASTPSSPAGPRRPRVTPFRVGLAIVAAGLLIALGGVVFGGDNTTETRSTEAVGDIIPRPDLDAPEPARNQPGGRTQMLLFGALVAGLGGLVTISSRSIKPRPNAGLGDAAPSRSASPSSPEPGPAEPGGDPADATPGT